MYIYLIDEMHTATRDYSVKGNIMTAKTITTAELATALDTTPRELRKFLRADAAANEKTDTLPGKGKRYELKGDARSIASMQKKFATWTEAQKVRNTDQADKSDMEVIDDAIAESDELTDPTDADIEDITAEL